MIYHNFYNLFIAIQWQIAIKIRNISGIYRFFFFKFHLIVRNVKKKKKKKKHELVHDLHSVTNFIVWFRNALKSSFLLVVHSGQSVAMYRFWRDPLVVADAVVDATASVELSIFLSIWIGCTFFFYPHAKHFRTSFWHDGSVWIQTITHMSICNMLFDLMLFFLLMLLLLLMMFIIWKCVDTKKNGSIRIYSLSIKLLQCRSVLQFADSIFLNVLVLFFFFAPLLLLYLFPYELFFFYFSLPFWLM